MTSASATFRTDARALLRSIATAKKAAIALHEENDTDLPGKVGDFVLLFPNGTLTVVTDEFMRRAALAFFASQRFQTGKPKPKVSNRDAPRATKLVNAMRAELRHCDEGVIPPPNFIDLALKHAVHADA